MCGGEGEILQKFCNFWYTPQLGPKGALGGCARPVALPRVNTTVAGGARWKCLRARPHGSPLRAVVWQYAATVSGGADDQYARGGFFFVFRCSMGEYGTGD